MLRLLLMWWARGAPRRWTSILACGGTRCPPRRRRRHDELRQSRRRQAEETRLEQAIGLRSEYVGDLLARRGRLALRRLAEHQYPLHVGVGDREGRYAAGLYVFVE